MPKKGQIVMVITPEDELVALVTAVETAGNVDSPTIKVRCAVFTGEGIFFTGWIPKGNEVNNWKFQS